jgi:hypothetical protein
MKSIFLLPAVLSVCLFSRATVLGADISIAFKGGLNLATWRGGDRQNVITVVNGIPEEKKSKPGLYFGLGLGIQFNDFFTLQPEFVSSMKGFKQVYKVQVIEGNQVVEKDNTVYLKVNYLEFPVLIKISLPVGAVNPVFYSGPAFAFRLKIKGYSELDGKKEDFTEQQNFAYNNNVRVFDFGLALGGGIDITAGPGYFILDIRYTVGFLNVWFGSNATDNYPDEKNSTLSFIAGYAIRF